MNTNATRNNPLEKTVEQQAVDWIESIGGLGLKLVLLNQRGFMDQTFLLPGGRVVFLEFKSRRGLLSPQQKKWIARLSALGFAVGVVRSLEEVQAICARA